MKLAYISPSTIPSRSANSVHVLQQCLALDSAGVGTTLFAKRATVRKAELAEEVGQAYGVSMGGLTLRTIFTPWNRGNNIVVALFACITVLTARNYDAVLSRNLFASFILSLFWRKPHLFEVHQIEAGFRGMVQRLVCRSRWVQVVAISEGLASDLRQVAGPELTVEVLHDAAPWMPAPPSVEDREQWRRELNLSADDQVKFVCGYVGHLYPGRGIEIIEGLARRLPDILFLVIGGNDSDIARRKREVALPNVRFLGHMPHALARRSMSAVDLLLMPYQEKVSIGIDGHDTARWMSPMKMFEYMSSGTAFVASDLPVLREVIRNGENAILVQPSDLDAWQGAVVDLRHDASRRRALAIRAYDDYQDKHTWLKRAQHIMALVGA